MKSALLLCMLMVAGADKKPELVPVVVAAVDIPAGTTVTIDMLSQRSVEARLVSSSFVTPDSATSIVNRQTLVPLVAGDALRWVFFVAHTGSKCPVSTGSAKQQLDHARGRVLAP